MGRIERKDKDGIINYVWYPGNLDDWKRAALSIGAGLGTALLAWIFLQSPALATVLGASITLGITGLSFGQRDAKSFSALGNLKSAETGRALWRALVKGFGPAAAAVLVAHVTPAAGLSSWVLPLVPAIVFAVAHQLGVVQTRLGEEANKKAEEAKALFPKRAAV